MGMRLVKTAAICSALLCSVGCVGGSNCCNCCVSPYVAERIENEILLEYDDEGLYDFYHMKIDENKVLTSAFTGSLILYFRSSIVWGNRGVIDSVSVEKVRIYEYR